MKKVLALVAAAGLIAAATTAFGASIVNSKHDLSNGSSVGDALTKANYSLGSSTQICIYCHAPHNANKSLPLWNRSNPAGTGFTLYSGVNMTNVSFKTGFTADSTSLFCMSCHDGVTSIAAVYNSGVIDGTGTASVHTAAGGVFATGVGPAGAMKAGVGGNLTTDLSKTHPINFPVSATLDTGLDLWVGSGAKMGNGGGAPPATTAGFPLFKTTDANALRASTNRSLECGSCHAVHDSANKPFLRYTMNKSQLCLGCHNK
jgi:predicted CXXCH cytochrome family protein